MKRMVAWLKHAFLVEKESDFQPDEQDLELIDTVCREIVKRGMATPAVHFLESTRPLNYVGSQTMTFFEPVMHAVLRHPEAWRRFAEILEHRGSVEHLCRRIDELSKSESRDDASGGRQAGS